MQAFIVCIHLVLHSPHLPLLHTGAGTDDCAISSILAISAPLPNCPYLAGELITIGKACRRDPVTNRIETDYARVHEEVGSSHDGMLAWELSSFWVLAFLPGINLGPAGRTWHMPLRGVRPSNIAYATKSDHSMGRLLAQANPAALLVDLHSAIFSELMCEIPAALECDEWIVTALGSWRQRAKAGDFSTLFAFELDSGKRNWLALPGKLSEWVSLDASGASWTTAVHCCQVDESNNAQDMALGCAIANCMQASHKAGHTCMQGMCQAVADTLAEKYSLVVVSGKASRSELIAHFFSEYLIESNLEEGRLIATNIV